MRTRGNMGWRKSLGEGKVQGHVLQACGGSGVTLAR